MYEIQSMNGAHHCMLDLVLQGFSNKEIAEKMGYTPQGVMQVINSPIFQHELARRRGNREKVHDEIVASTVVEARDFLQSKALDAAKRLVDKMENTKDERIEMMSIREVLDRSIGVEAPPSNISVQILSVERLQLLQQSIQERGKEVAA